MKLTTQQQSKLLNYTSSGFLFKLIVDAQNRDICTDEDTLDLNFKPSAAHVVYLTDGIRFALPTKRRGDDQLHMIFEASFDPVAVQDFLEHGTVQELSSPLTYKGHHSASYGYMLEDSVISADSPNFDCYALMRDMLENIGVIDENNVVLSETLLYKFIDQVNTADSAECMPMSA